MYIYIHRHSIANVNIPSSTPTHKCNHNPKLSLVPALNKHVLEEYKGDDTPRDRVREGTRYVEEKDLCVAGKDQVRV